MSEPPKKITEKQLERYLDGQMSTEEKAEFELQLANDPNASKTVETDRDLDIQLRHAFSPPSVTAEQIDKLITVESPDVELTNPATNKRRRRTRLLVAAIVVASIGWALVVWQWAGHTVTEPFFEPRSLTVIYRETVKQGFRPYYFCEDEDRFAMTFAKRQKAALQLSQMPSDRRMVGLSYPGGLSRNTTAMLCYFHEQPVIVFIDRREFDNEIRTSSEESLYVHRQELGDLVIYEIGPINQPKFAKFLKMRKE